MQKPVPSAFPSVNRQGIVTIQRVAGDNIALREALNAVGNNYDLWH